MNTNRITLFALLTLTLPQATISRAADRIWTGTSGNWSAGSNWSGGVLPANGDRAIIVHADGVARTVTYDIAAASLDLLVVDLARADTASNTLFVPFASNNLSAAGTAVFYPDRLRRVFGA